jgi:microcystin-dependent protein
MSDPFVAEIRMFPFNFPPTGWAFCDGQILPISQNTALFSLLGTTYGGDGKSTFALPNLQGSAPLQPGQGPGLSIYDLGETTGSETVTLITTEMPVHTHFFSVTSDAGTVATSSDAQLAMGSGGTKQNTFLADLYSPNAGSANTMMSFAAITVAGGSLPHNNMQPYLTLNFCIALQGIFPPRS